MTTIICPICGHILKEGETLDAKFVPERNWWVLYHMKPVAAWNINQPMIFNAICGQANYKLVFQGVIPK